MDTDENQNKLVAEFCSVADVPEQRARFYLESANWQLPVALSSFFDSGNAFDMPEEDDIADVQDNVPETTQPVDRPAGSTSEKKNPPTRSKFASIHDYKDTADNDEDEGQRFYAGGEKSGELIVGPPKHKDNKSIASSLFTEAKKHGAQPVDASSRESHSSKKKAKDNFQSGGYKLGDSSSTASEYVQGRKSKEESQDPQEPMSVILKLWSNGFTVNDGEMRDYQDPANEEFLNSVKNGEIPRELLRLSHGGQVHVDMEDHRNEEYKAPKKKVIPFSGQGHMLGSPVPTPSFEPSPPIGSGESSSVDPPVVVDESQPKTTVQIRLSDGTRLRQQFNHTHRISDIRATIFNRNPLHTSRDFVLMTTFPNKELSDESLTLKDANLLNSQVVQKLK